MHVDATLMQVVRGLDDHGGPDVTCQGVGFMGPGRMMSWKFYSNRASFFTGWVERQCIGYPVSDLVRSCLVGTARSQSAAKRHVRISRCIEGIAGCS